jgi:glycogen operon protein
MSLTEFLARAKPSWHGVRVGQPDWGAQSHSLAFGADFHHAGLRLHAIMNAYREPLEFELPVPEGERGWRRWVDTSLDAPDDIVPWQESPRHEQPVYRVGPRSVVVLWAPLE